jgi:ferrous iron transport protein B
MFKVAIAGCANVGKTTLFNLLTGKKNKTGNWEGVTVEVSNAKMLFSKDIQIFDLPGIKSLLTADISKDQTVTKDFIINQEIDLIVNVVTAEHLRRDLKLSIELYETGKPILIVLVDHHNKIPEDFKLEFFNCEIIHINLKQKGIIGEIINKIKNICHNRSGRFLEKPLEYCKVMNYPIQTESNLITAIEEFTKSEENLSKISAARNIFINNAIVNLKQQTKQTNKSISHTIDRIIMNRFLAIPIFIMIVSLVLCMTIVGGNFFKPYFEDLADNLIVQPITFLLKVVGAPHAIININEFGIGSGIRTIASFIPLLSILYILLGLIDESGYMTRISVVMGKIAAKVGLSGKSIIPLVVGFGCNVPAIMGARIIENEKQRLLTVILIPFMSCSARLVVFALFSAAFFPNNAALIICCLYFFSIFLAGVVAFTLQPYFVERNHSNVSISLLPKYKTPNIKNILRHTISKIKHFLMETSTTITVMSVALYILASVPAEILTLKPEAIKFEEKVTEESLLVHFSKKFSYIFEPIGISQDNWPATVSLMTGVVAKEVVASTLVTLYGINEQSDIDPTDLVKKYFKHDTDAFAYLLFVLIYFPCITVFSVMQKEMSTKVAVYSSLFYTTFAYVVAATFHKISLYTNNSILISMGILIGIITILSYTIRMVIGKRLKPL